MSDEVGYAVEYGRGGFFGGVGGPREPLKGCNLYKELSKLVEPADGRMRRRHVKVGMKSDKDLHVWWTVVEGMLEYKNMDPEWTLHRRWWTLGELRQALNTKELLGIDMPNENTTYKKTQDALDVSSDSSSSQTGTALSPKGQSQDHTTKQRSKGSSQKCDECGQVGQSHSGPVPLISCYNCGRHYAEACLFENRKIVPHKMQGCGWCFAVHVRLEQMVSEWEEMKAGMHNIEKRLASLESNLPKVRSKAKQDSGDVDHEKVKEADRRCVMAEERLSRLTNEIEKLKQECWQAKEKQKGMKNSMKALLQQKDAEVQEARRAMENECQETLNLKRQLQDMERQLHRTEGFFPASLQEIMPWVGHGESLACHYDPLWRETDRKFVEDAGTVVSGSRSDQLPVWNSPIKGNEIKQQEVLKVRLPMEKAAHEENLRKRVAMVQEELEIVKKRRRWNKQGHSELEEGEVDHPFNCELDWTTLHDVQVMEDLEQKGQLDDAAADNTLKLGPENHHNIQGILGKQILFVGDNFIMPIAKDSGLEATALERGWDVTFKYGALAFEVFHMLKEQGSRIRQYRWVVLSAGSNTIKNAPHGSLKELDSYLTRLVMQPLHEAVKLCLKNDTKVVLLIPPPRRDLKEWVRFRAISQLDQLILQEGGCTFHMDLKYETADQYVACLLPDGVNFREIHFRDILVKLLQFMGENPELRPPEYKLSVQVCCRNFCKTCGGPISNVHGIPSHQHVKFEACQICDDPRHAANVCLHRFKMCLKCGHRGHKAAKCLMHTRYLAAAQGFHLAEMQPSIAAAATALQTEPKKKRSHRRGKKARKRAESLCTSITAAAAANSTTKTVLVDLPKANLLEQKTLSNMTTPGEVREGMLLGDQLWVKGSLLSSAAAALRKNCESAAKHASNLAADEIEGALGRTLGKGFSRMQPTFYRKPLPASRTPAVTSGMAVTSLQPTAIVSVEQSQNPAAQKLSFASGLVVATQDTHTVMKTYSAQQKSYTTVAPPGWQLPVPELGELKWPHNLVVTEGIPGSAIPLEESVKKLASESKLRDKLLSDCMGSKFNDEDLQQVSFLTQMQGKGELGESKLEDLGESKLEGCDVSPESSDLPPGVSDLPPQVLVHAPPRPDSFISAAKWPESEAPFTDSQSTGGPPDNDSQSGSPHTLKVSTTTTPKRTTVPSSAGIVTNVTASTTSVSAPAGVITETETADSFVKYDLSAIGIASVDQKRTLAGEQAGMKVKDSWQSDAEVSKADVEEGELLDIAETCSSRASRESRPQRSMVAIRQHKAKGPKYSKVLGTTSLGFTIGEKAGQPSMIEPMPTTGDFCLRKSNKAPGKLKRRKKKKIHGKSSGEGVEHVTFSTSGSLWEQEVRELYGTESLLS